jgi:WD40 repeat protein
MVKQRTARLFRTILGAGIFSNPAEPADARGRLADMADLKYHGDSKAGSLDTDKPTVFISYSRKDIDFVDRLHDALDVRGIDARIDREDIEKSEEWWSRIQQLIVEADTIIFVLSPESAISSVCQQEVDFAEGLRKRLIPIVARDLAAQPVPAALARLNYIHFTANLTGEATGDFNAALDELVHAIETNISWIREHTRLGSLARRWEALGRPHELELNGKELSGAETWLTTRPRKAPDPTDAHRTFITESRRTATARQRKIVVMLISAVIAALTLSGLAVWQWRVAVAERNLALISESRVIAKQAEDAIEMGKASDGIFLAIKALPGSPEMPKRPYVASAEAALIHGLSVLREKSVYNAGSDSIDQVALSPTGSHLLTKSSWGEVRLWDIGSVSHTKVLNKRVNSIHDGAEAAEFIAFDPTGKRIVVTSLDHTARLWNILAGSDVRLIGHKGLVRHAAFSPDGSLVATASEDATVRIWRSDSGEPIATLEGHNGQVNHVEFDTKGTRIVSSSADKTARVWNTDGWGLIAKLNNGAQVGFSHFSPDGKVLLVVSQPDAIVIGAPIQKIAIENTASLRNAASGELISNMKGHAGYIQDAEFSQDGEHILTVSDDGTARIWSSPQGELVETYSDLPEEAYTETHGMSGGKFIDHGQRFITVGHDAKIRIWTLGVPRATAVMSEHKNGIYGLAISEDRSLFATASADGTARVWEAHSLEDLSTIRDDDILSDALRTVLAENTVTYGFNLPALDSTRIVRWRGNKAVLEHFKASKDVDLDGHTGAISRAEFSPNGKYLSTVCGRTTGTMGFGPRGKDFTARIWDAQSGSLVAVLSDHGRNVERAKFSPLAGTMATASLDGKARVWSLPDGKLKRILDGGNQSMFDLAFSPDGTRLVTASEDGIGRVWQMSDGVLVTTLSGHQGPIEHVEFSPNGRYILTASRDGTARIWDAASGASQKVLLFGDDLNFAAFLAGGTKIATALIDPGKYVGDGAFGSFLNERTASRSIVIWDASSGEKLQELPHEDSIRNLIIVNDGKQILSETGVMKGIFRIWKPFLTTRDALAAARDAAPKQAIAVIPPSR